MGKIVIPSFHGQLRPGHVITALDQLNQAFELINPGVLFGSQSNHLTKMPFEGFSVVKTYLFQIRNRYVSFLFMDKVKYSLQFNREIILWNPGAKKGI